jgi:hypothetical protein
MTSVYRLLYRFDLQSAQFDARIGFCLALIWAVVLVCAISSIRSRTLSVGQQRLWILVVTFLPVVGLLAYLPFSVRQDDMPHYFRFRSRDHHRRGARSKVRKATRADDIG